MYKALSMCLLVLLLAIPALADGDEGDMLVAENGRLALRVSQNLAGITVEDKLTGMRWSSSMDDETFQGRMNAAWQKKMSSLLMINYTNLKKGLGVINNMALLGDAQYEASYELIENGICLHYSMGASGISLRLEIILDENSLLLRLPRDGIREEGAFSLVSVDLLPFFCAASDNADGYFLYPDGSGAIMEFQDGAHKNEKTQLYSIYGNMESAPALQNFFELEEPEVLLPVFGMKLGENGVLVTLEEGAETSRISLNASTNIIGVNYIFANVQFRRGFDDLRVTNRSLKMYDANAIDADYSLRVLFLPPDEGDYSGMARAYREYLVAREGLGRTEAAPRIALDIFMTAPEKGLLFDVQRTVTTFAQAKEILAALNEANVQNVNVSLKGWSGGGYGKTPDNLPANRAIGGNAGLKRFLEAAADMDYPVTLTVNLTEATADQSGYSKRNDVVYTNNYAILTNAQASAFILSPDVTYARFGDLLAEAKRFALSGMRFERIGAMVGFNYGSKHIVSAKDCLQIYREMLRATKEAFGAAEAQGGALYALPYADIVTEVPAADSGYRVTTKTVPFYQMVLHGLVEYAGTPGNLSSDLNREVLRWAEMGYVPYFELTYENTEKLMYTRYQSLFTARYADWLDRVREISERFTGGDLAEVKNAFILRHEAIFEDVYKVTYDNRRIVYVNYTNSEVLADGFKIPAMDFLVAKE